LDKNSVHSLDHQNLSEFLMTNLPETGELKEISKFGTGQSNPTYLLVTANGKYVLRKNHPESCCPLLMQSIENIES